jgi:Zn-dependent peptidase ImmA (M78 family)
MGRTHTFTTLMRRLSSAGFPRDFVRPAILPDWWDADCERDPALLPDLEIRIARFLQRSIADVRDPSVDLAAPVYAHAQLRRVHDVDRDRLGPAIHTALQIAGAVARSLRSADRPVTPEPADALAWRASLSTVGGSVRLDDMLGDLWGRGIPVVPVDVLPVPTFQGLACVVDDRPVILIGHKIDQPGRVAFVVAHEIGHVAAGDCAPNQPVVDEDETVADDSDMERTADRFATLVTVGREAVPQIDGDNFRALAKRAAELEKTIGVDAGVVLFAWARRAGGRPDHYQTATLALKALYQHQGARKRLREHFDRNVDVEGATETDRVLLRCVYGGDRDSATAD